MVNGLYALVNNFMFLVNCFMIHMVLKYIQNQKNKYDITASCPPIKDGTCFTDRCGFDPRSICICVHFLRVGT